MPFVCNYKNQDARVRALYNRVALFHLKKTAGTSAYRHLREAVRPDLAASWSLSFELARSYDVMGGHYSFKEITSLDALKICFLRDPVERVISLYNYVHTLSKQEIIRNRDAGATAMYSMSLEECLDSDDQNVLYDVSNHYCKNFFGRDYVSSEIFSEDGLLTDYASTEINRIDFFGFQENFESSILEMMDFLGLSRPRRIHREKNISDLVNDGNKFAGPDEIKSLSTRIMLLNADDMALYRNIQTRRSTLASSRPNYILGDFPRAEVGRKYQFKGVVDSFANILYRGWYGVEDGVWSKGATAALAVSNNSDANLVVLEIEVPLQDKVPSKTITVTVNEKSMHRAHIIHSHTAFKIADLKPADRFVSPDSAGKFLLSIPVGHISEPVYHMVISIDKIFVPARHEATGDDRELGFKIHHVSVL